MNQLLRNSQVQVCENQKVEICECFSGDKLGVSQSALDGQLPLNGMRYASRKGMSGWYLWGSEEFSEDRDFFKPLHAGHLEELCPMALKFLFLPPGWRFLTDGSYEDVWFDENLLMDEV